MKLYCEIYWPAPGVSVTGLELGAFWRLTGALLASSGGASGEVDIVPFSEGIRTFRRGDGKGHAVLAVSAIFMRRVLLGAVDGAVTVEIPGPSGYITCGFIDEVKCGGPFARCGVTLDLAIRWDGLDGEVGKVGAARNLDIIFLYLGIVAFRTYHCQADCIVARSFIGVITILQEAIDGSVAIKVPDPDTDVAC